MQVQRPEQVGGQVAVGAQQFVRVQVDADDVADKGEHVPGGHEDAVELQVAPAAAGEGGAADIPEEVAQREEVVQVGHLVDIQPFRPAVHLQGPGLAGQAEDHGQCHEDRRVCQVSCTHARVRCALGAGSGPALAF